MKKFVVYLFVVIGLAFGLSLISTANAAPAQAACSGDLCFEHGGGDNGALPPPSSGGGGGSPGGPIIGYWHSYYGNYDSVCPVRPSDGAHAIGILQLILLDGSLAQQVCIYPLEFQEVPATCWIAFHIKADKTGGVAPLGKFEEVSSRTGYGAGDSSIDSCLNSHAYAKLDTKMTSYGFYTISTREDKQDVIIKRQVVSDDEYYVLLETVEDEIISRGKTVSTDWRERDSASLDCLRPVATSPGVWSPHLWNDEAPECRKSAINPAGAYWCAVDSTQVDASDTNKVSMLPVKNTIQFMRDGKSREVKFDNRIVTTDRVRIDSTSTVFSRSAGSTPWNPDKAYNNNLFEASRTADGSSDLSIKGLDGSTRTPSYSGVVDSIFTRGYYASDIDMPTELTQEVKWKGQRLIDNVMFSHIDEFGNVVTKVVPTWVPTTGLCNTTVSLDYVRAIGHEAG